MQTTLGTTFVAIHGENGMSSTFEEGIAGWLFRMASDMQVVSGEERDDPFPGTILLTMIDSFID